MRSEIYRCLLDIQCFLELQQLQKFKTIPKSFKWGFTSILKATQWLKHVQQKQRLLAIKNLQEQFHFSLNNNFFNLNTKIHHLDQMNKYQEYYNLAMAQFKSPSNKVELPEKLNFMKLGQRRLLLYLLEDNSKNNQLTAFYLLILYIYQLFQ
ncbi:hypothetical protein TTHERM_000783218 (macronuclear) [Tetrahymena thermophila SB210]|uniref:Uncharacterized protein n=1 Tax=Tetrahymena thermophila (strain SB210) TaxID=312017 RepID=W7XFB4_TETTS|nr:hypothetical protein TTHERM_000783218 [Tetrahymena thermophila SB210]EWS75523.1 hypothetical protein TTHERM_000783218 [Tetrahymena thermophila SB210]|eukprot:XP_012651992.1 hypothetical protein TTHERM_000783218 [Tetrahymena thermophila SB210]